MQLTFASYNIHKGIGLDRRRDPERIINVLNELGADIIALQEADRRLGRRAAVIPRQMLAEHHWQLVPLAARSESMGWHGNAILVRRGVDILDAEPITLPTLEPRGAVCARLRVDGRIMRVVGMHLDLSGLRRRHQIEAICSHMARGAEPSILMGDLNEWSNRKGALRAFGPEWNVLAPGKSFPSRRPLARLDRIVISPEWRCVSQQVHHSALAAIASDHLPVSAALQLPA
ncbi:endonuclease/exonuclease/phosphatase family protein [Altericroceibacterium endophyticum]|uniref:Endonuclease n=1 Tax=Altericroceibacterium endophyticum TaxID=1808508 RepID=A0A6I4T429_9SPHN|nr:endonuclease/exonuclease/phosphatase family protein [Altericroceibacterium endophyticum]MXO65518.1 endonuclease [Altericroceibacterium endophyticum]